MQALPIWYHSRSSHNRLPHHHWDHDGSTQSTSRCRHARRIHPSRSIPHGLDWKRNSTLRSCCKSALFIIRLRDNTDQYTVKRQWQLQSLHQWSTNNRRQHWHFSLATTTRHLPILGRSIRFLDCRSNLPRVALHHGKPGKPKTIRLISQSSISNLAYTKMIFCWI